MLTKYLDPLPVAELLTPYAATNVGGVDTYDVGMFQSEAYPSTLLLAPVRLALGIP